MQASGIYELVIDVAAGRPRRGLLDPPLGSHGEAPAAAAGVEA